MNPIVTSLRRIGLSLLTGILVLGTSSTVLAQSERYYDLVIDLAVGQLDDYSVEHIHEFAGDGNLADILRWSVPDGLADHRHALMAERLSTVTLPYERSFQEIEGTPEAFAVTALENLPAEILIDNRSDAERLLALRLIVRIISDLHLPYNLNLGPQAQTSEELPENAYENFEELKSYWNDELLELDTLTEEIILESVERLTSEGEREMWRHVPVASWINQSAIMRDGILRMLPEMQEEGQEWVMDSAKVRLYEASVHTAVYLNIILSEEARGYFSVEN